VARHDRGLRRAVFAAGGREGVVAGEHGGRIDLHVEDARARHRPVDLRIARGRVSALARTRLWSANAPAERAWPLVLRCSKSAQLMQNFPEEARASVK